MKRRIVIALISSAVLTIGISSVAAASTGYTFKSKGRIVFDNGTADPSDDFILDSSDLTTIETEVTDGKEAIKTAINNVIPGKITDTLPTFETLTNAIPDVFAAGQADVSSVWSQISSDTELASRGYSSVTDLPSLKTAIAADNENHKNDVILNPEDYGLIKQITDTTVYEGKLKYIDSTTSNTINHLGSGSLNASVTIPSGAVAVGCSFAQCNANYNEANATNVSRHWTFSNATFTQSGTTVSCTGSFSRDNSYYNSGNCVFRVFYVEEEDKSIVPLIKKATADSNSSYRNQATIKASIGVPDGSCILGVGYNTASLSYVEANASGKASPYLYNPTVSLSGNTATCVAAGDTGYYGTSSCQFAVYYISPTGGGTTTKNIYKEEIANDTDLISREASYASVTDLDSLKTAINNDVQASFQEGVDSIKDAPGDYGLVVKDNINFTNVTTSISSISFWDDTGGDSCGSTYTVPEDGVYCVSITVSAYTNGPDTGYSSSSGYVINGQTTYVLSGLYVGTSQTSNTYLKLNKGDTVQTRLVVTKDTTGNKRTSHSATITQIVVY